MTRSAGRQRGNRNHHRDSPGLRNGVFPTGISSVVLLEIQIHNYRIQIQSKKKIGSGPRGGYREGAGVNK